MRQRGWLAAGFGFALLLLGTVAAWALASFAMPADEFVDIGQLTDYPPSSQPYELQDPVHLFVVNDGGNIIVLDPLNRVSGGYVVRWWPQEGYFIDPGRGSWFDLLGRSVAHHGVPAQQGLPRYPVTIRDGHILVEVSQLVVPTGRPGAQP